MLRISLQTLRARRGTLTGAFVAIWLAVTLASATGLLMAGALGPPGGGRLGGAHAGPPGPSPPRRYRRGGPRRPDGHHRPRRGRRKHRRHPGAARRLDDGR